MGNDRDALDERLLAQRRHDELLAAYYPVMLARLRLRVGDGEAYEVVHRAVDRLLGELSRGKRYPVPFRVVVHQVTGWTLKGYMAERGKPFPTLPSDWDLPGDTTLAEDVVADQWVRYMIGRLPPGRDREVAMLRYVEGMEIADIGEHLGIRRNAVDQSLHRAHGRLRKLMDDD